MTKSNDPRLADESRFEEIRRRASELAQDLPQLAKIALESMIRDHNPDYKGTANSAGRVGKQSGNVSELTATTGWQVAEGWRATAETRYDFVADRAQKAELGLEFRNECVTVDLSVSRRFTSSDTVRADTDVGLSVRLGGFGRQRDTGPGTVARRSCLR